MLVFGGSQGAKAINAAVAPAMKAAGIDAQVLHLAGKDKSREAVDAYGDAGIRATVLDYCEDMASAYAAADVVVCRSGASTLAELAAQKKRAILVPYPHAAANHQDFNARVFERIGAAKRIPENELGTHLGTALAEMLSSTTSPAYAELGLPSADRTTTNFVDELERLL
ncbi:MAG: UDP-N-acetylglucosamine--N-acetylmuramyl-(pentapeptide) pyrophosphoryl-undecaprenol N-acetylglucosamine transferase [Elusimicrobiota bacterium]|nr:MAG: UDP-N-acetylglucosamine--N-acetylmuramyl-(pentapeptide) pyrophosphoryl-undecaprenol N-acetylglucosamine transferase [Elusimicrobiota bacterium]